AHHHALEMHEGHLSAIHVLEKRMDIRVQWEAGSREWKDTAKKVTMRRYQCSIDALEGLIVTRMFKLTKMNMSQTGYSMQKHITNTLKARSQAIHTCLDKFNLATLALNPPRPTLDWDEVMAYTFLSDFNLLCDT
ncbi:hypothetical protein BDN70DRAFT_763402, partial [Pholiota conissans]